MIAVLFALSTLQKITLPPVSRNKNTAQIRDYYCKNIITA